MRRNHLITALALAILLLSRSDAGAQEQGRKSNLYLLTIGVSKHAKASGDFKDLRFAAKDAEDLAAFYRKQKGSMFGQVYSLTLTNEKATRAAIENALSEMTKLDIRSDDYVIVQIAGHGAETFFVPHDFDPFRRNETGVPWTTFRKALGSLSGKRMLILDTCHAAGATASVSRIVSAGNDLITIAACMSKEHSLEGDDPNNFQNVQNGVFTHALLEALRGKADSDKDGTITLAEMDAYVSNRVKSLTKGKQNTTVERFGSISSTFVLAQLGSVSGGPVSTPVASVAPVTQQSGSGPDAGQAVNTIRPKQR